MSCDIPSLKTYVLFAAEKKVSIVHDNDNKSSWQNFKETFLGCLNVD